MAQRRVASKQNVILATEADWDYWTLRFNCTRHQLADAISVVGTKAASIQIHLKSRRTPNIADALFGYYPRK